MQDDELDEIMKKLLVLKNYNAVFKGAGVRQVLPRCCGHELDLGEFLRTKVRPLDVEVNGERLMMFEVTCPACGRVIPPEWR